MSDLNQFRSKGPELLVELAQHTSETVREISKRQRSTVLTLIYW